MKYFDFQLNIPSVLLKDNSSTTFILVHYGVEDGRIYLDQLDIPPGLGTNIKSWSGLESVAQGVAEELEASKAEEKAILDEEFESLKDQITY